MGDPPGAESAWEELDKCLQVEIGVDTDLDLDNLDRTYRAPLTWAEQGGTREARGQVVVGHSRCPILLD